MLEVIWFLFFAPIFAANGANGVPAASNGAPHPPRANRPLPQPGMPPRNVEALSALNSQPITLRVFFRNCFASTSRPQSDLLTISGQDGHRYVQLTLQIRSPAETACCILEWKVQARAGAESPIPDLIGGITSLRMTDLSPTPLDVLDSPQRRVKIKVCGGQNPGWSLEHMNTNNLVSPRFIQSFIAKGLVIEDLFYEAFTPQNEPLPRTFLFVEDESYSRELHWLEKGKTYFQSWGLEYDCVLAMTEEQQSALRNIVAESFQITTEHAFADSSFQSLTSPYDPDKTYIYHPTFKEAISAYNMSRTLEQRRSMTTRDALNQFIRGWKSANLIEEIRDSFSVNTFMFFFKHHQQFDLLARIVIHGYDPSCERLHGIPNDPVPFHYHYSYHYNHDRILGLQRQNLLARAQAVPGGPQANVAQMGPEVIQVGTNNRKSNFLHIFIVFTFLTFSFILFHFYFKTSSLSIGVMEAYEEL